MRKKTKTRRTKLKKTTTKKSKTTSKPLYSNKGLDKIFNVISRKKGVKLKKVYKATYKGTKAFQGKKPTFTEVTSGSPKKFPKSMKMGHGITYKLGKVVDTKKYSYGGIGPFEK